MSKKKYNLSAEERICRALDEAERLEIQVLDGLELLDKIRMNAPVIKKLEATYGVRICVEYDHAISAWTARKGPVTRLSYRSRWEG
jgi:hypothetical protein